MNENKMIEYAIQYAESGFPVFPLIPKSKQPLTKNGCNDATTNEDQIVKLWGENPEANIGISTAGLVVIDVDGADNKWCRDSPELFIKLSENAVCMTPRGGAHYWFMQPKNTQVKCSVGHVAYNVDIRGDGGYVVAPPSYVVDEKKGIDGAYNWVSFQSLGMRSELSPCPEWVIKQIETGKKESISVMQDGNKIPEGKRNSTLAKLAGIVRRYGCSETEIRSLLRATNAERLTIPLPTNEVDQVARSIARYEPDQFSVALIEDWAGDNEKDINYGDAVSDPGNLPIEFTDVPGLMGEIIKYNQRTAFKRQPELALAASIALMATITGRKIEDNYGTRTNAYIFGIAGSGSGKEHARSLNKKILVAAGADEMIGPEGFASHAGVISAVENQPTILFQIDEFGRLLKTLKNPASSPHLYGIITNLLKLYTSANTQFVGDAYADTTKIKRITEPHAVLYGTTVPQSFFEGLTIENLNDGFLSRCLCFFATEDLPELSEIERYEIPEIIIQRTKEWIDFEPGGNLAGLNPQPEMISQTDAAKEIFADVEKECRKHQKDKSSPFASMWSRVEEKARTMAIIHACSRDGIHEPTIDDDSASWGASLAEFLTKQLIYRAGHWVTQSVHDERAKKLYREILKAGSDGLTRTQVARKMSYLTSRERIEVIDTLEATGQIKQVVSDDKSTGPKKTVYRVVENG